MIQTDYNIGDSRDIYNILKKNKSKKPNLIITSPPYYDIKNYENKKKQIGYGQNFSEYKNDIVNIFQQCYNYSSKNATFWLIMDNIRRDGELIPLSFELINKMNKEKKHTWKLKDIIIWSKQKNIPWHHKGILKNHFEFILFLTKNGNYKFNIDKMREVADLKKWWISYPERYNPNGKVPTNIWEFNSPIRGWGNGCQKHFCPFPFQLVERIISLSTDKGDLVLDPFAGSGSVLAIAKQMGRNSIGVDINKTYKKKFEQEVLPGAERYWKKRKKDLLKIGKNIGKFQKANYSLRKLKFCGNIITNYISNELTTDKYRFLCVEDKNNLEMKIIILSKEKKANINFINSYEKELKQISQIYKVKANFETMTIKELYNQNIELNFFEYNPLKTNKYISEISKQEFSFNKLNKTNIYSNIALNISRTNDLFK